MTLSRQLAEKIRALSCADIPDDVRTCGKLHFLDAVGVGLASAGNGVGAPYLKAATALGGTGRASVLGSRVGKDAASAALLNGGLIHGLEFDDTHTGSIVHGSAVLAPTAFAVGQDVDASGADVLRAYILGWEVLVRIGLAAPGGFQSRGFQVTPVGGTFVAALQTAELLGLDVDRTVAALGIALSQASGVFEFLTNGSSVKSMHPGWAAHAGIVAANLAAAGLTGPETAIEGRMGLFQQFTNGGADAAARFAASLETLGRRWHIVDAAYKFLPCCHYIHPYVEALDQLRTVSLADIRSIHCLVAPGAAQIICEPWSLKQSPTTGHEARWSLPIVLAARLIDGTVGHSTFAAPASAAVRDLAARMSWSPMQTSAFPQRFEAELLVTSRDGSQQRCRVEDVLGGATRPPSAGQIRAKFTANAGLVCSAGDASGLDAAISVMEHHPVSKLSAYLNASGPAP